MNNKSASANSKYYVNTTTQDIPAPDDNNYGEVNTAAGDDYYMVMYDYFDRVYGFT
jgi:hypothetical protein